MNKQLTDRQAKRYDTISVICSMIVISVLFSTQIISDLFDIYPPTHITAAGLIISFMLITISIYCIHITEQAQEIKNQ